MAKELGILGILRESSRALLLNAKLILLIVLFLVFPFKIITSSRKLNPLLTINLTSPAIFLAPKFGFRKPSYVNLKLEPLNFVYSNLISSSFIYLSVLACTGSHFGLKELASKIRRTWKWLAVTLLQGELITQVFGFFFSIVSFMLNVMSKHDNDSEHLAILFGGLLIILGVSVLLLYLVFIIRVSQVVCIVEERCYGMNALARAYGLIKWRKLQLIGLIGLTTAMAYGFDGVAKAALRGIKGGWRMMSAVEVVKLLIFGAFDLIIGLFKSVVLGFYYLECKREFGSRRVARKQVSRDVLNVDSLKVEGGVAP